MSFNNETDLVSMSQNQVILNKEGRSEEIAWFGYNQSEETWFGQNKRVLREKKYNFDTRFIKMYQKWTFTQCQHWTLILITEWYNYNEFKI